MGASLACCLAGEPSSAGDPPGVSAHPRAPSAPQAEPAAPQHAFVIVGAAAGEPAPSPRRPPVAAAPDPSLSPAPAPASPPTTQASSINEIADRQLLSSGRSFAGRTRDTEALALALRSGGPLARDSATPGSTPKAGSQTSLQSPFQAAPRSQSQDSMGPVAGSQTLQPWQQQDALHRGLVPPRMAALPAPQQPRPARDASHGQPLGMRGRSGARCSLELGTAGRDASGSRTSGVTPLSASRSVSPAVLINAARLTASQRAEYSPPSTMPGYQPALSSRLFSEQAAATSAAAATAFAAAEPTPAPPPTRGPLFPPPRGRSVSPASRETSGDNAPSAPLPPLQHQRGSVEASRAPTGRPAALQATPSWALLASGSYSQLGAAPSIGSSVPGVSPDTQLSTAGSSSASGGTARPGGGSRPGNGLSQAASLSLSLCRLAQQDSSAVMPTLPSGAAAEPLEPPPQPLPPTRVSFQQASATEPVGLGRSAEPSSAQGGAGTGRGSAGAGMGGSLSSGGDSARGHERRRQRGTAFRERFGTMAAAMGLKTTAERGARHGQHTAPAALRAQMCATAAARAAAAAAGAGGAIRGLHSASPSLQGSPGSWAAPPGSGGGYHARSLAEPSSSTPSSLAPGDLSPGFEPVASPFSSSGFYERGEEATGARSALTSGGSERMSDGWPGAGPARPPLRPAPVQHDRSFSQPLPLLMSRLGGAAGWVPGAALGAVHEEASEEGLTASNASNALTHPNAATANAAVSAAAGAPRASLGPPPITTGADLGTGGLGHGGLGRLGSEAMSSVVSTLSWSSGTGHTPMGSGSSGAALLPSPPKTAAPAVGPNSSHAGGAAAEGGAPQRRLLQPGAPPAQGPAVHGLKPGGKSAGGELPGCPAAGSGGQAGARRRGCRPWTLPCMLPRHG
jgi:hypothetical protein